MPHGDEKGFVILQKDDIQIMYQSRASVADDLESAAGAEAPSLSQRLVQGTSVVFLTVDDLDPVIEAVQGHKIVVPRRQTFYGMDEVFVEAPCGTLVGFAAHLDEEEG